MATRRRRSTVRLGVDFVKRRYSEWPFDRHGNLPRKFKEAGMDQLSRCSRRLYRRSESHLPWQCRLMLAVEDRCSDSRHFPGEKAGTAKPARFAYDQVNW